MNEQRLPLHEPDEATLARDDALLDALGRGGSVPGGDPLALALSMWREDLSEPSTATIAAQRARRKRRRLTWGVIAAALAAAIGTGATVAAASTAEPGSPLWPITERIFTQQASTASAQAAKVRIADAGAAVVEQRLPEAKALLDEAEALIANVTSLAERDALTAELNRVRGLLAAALGGTPAPAPPPTGVPAPAPAPSAGGGAPQGTPSPSKPGGLLPLPTISVPPLLPSLPLP